MNNINGAGRPHKRFIPGQVYQNTCWFTGGVSKMRVERLANGRVYFSVQRMEADGFHETAEDYPLSYDGEDNESVLLYSYKGE